MTMPSPSRTGTFRSVVCRAAAFAAAAGFAVALAHTLGFGSWRAASASAHTGPTWQWQLPGGFPEPIVPASNRMTTQKTKLGRRLFYEPRLSGNGTQSCGSCHMQSKAFTDGRAQAIGSTGEVHPRGALSIANIAYNRTFAWANPALSTPERQILVPIFGTNPVEMGVTDKTRMVVLRRLRADKRYRAMFAAAFPGQRQPINWSNIAKAITTFERTMISGSSKYDRYVRRKATLTASERRGMNLFFGEKAECHHCHSGLNFNDQTRFVGSPSEPLKFHNTGLYNLGGTGAFPEPNTGLHEVTGKATDMGRFRVPTLRNVAVTAPYMHDGSIATLREVVDFYAAGGRIIAEGDTAGDGRMNPFKDPLIQPIDLTEQDRQDLVAFLGTLTDRTFLTNPALSDPFGRVR